MAVRRSLILAIVAIGACGGGGGASEDAAVHDGPSVQADSMVPDAGVADAEMPDAEMPDADLSPCQLPAFTTGVSTLAGCEVSGAVDGPRVDARFANPANVVIGPDGDLYVADFDNNRVRAVSPTGITRTVVMADNFRRPFGLAFAVDGTLFVQTDDNDLGQHSALTGTIWRVNTTTGVATVVVSNVGRPRGIVVIGDGRIAMADYVHHVVRLLDPSNGTITDLAGTFDQMGWVDATGGAARFWGPYGIAVLPGGSLAVADLFNHRIRVVELDGDVTTLTGTGVPGSNDGAVATATLNNPQGLATDDAGNLYVSDVGNFVIRKVAGGQVATVVGDGTAGYLDSADLRMARIFGMEGLDVAADGASLWIADGSRGEDAPHHRVRIVDLTP